MGNKDIKYLFWFLRRYRCHREPRIFAGRGDPVHQRDCFGCHRQPRNDKFATGFTLVELLVGIAIVGLISTVAVANFRQGQRSTELRLAAEEIVAQIRQAQTMSTAGRATKLCQDGDKNGLACVSTSDCDTGSCAEQVPLGGYGLYFIKDQKTSFTLFADGINNKSYQSGEEVANGTINLPSSVEVDEISNGDTNDLTIVFEPPKGKVYIHGMAGGTAQIILKHKVTQDTKTVFLDAVSGRIEIE